MPSALKKALEQNLQSRKGPKTSHTATGRLAIVACIALILTGCAATNDGSVSVDDLEHVHSVATDGESFYLASHHGLYVLSDDSWKLQGDKFDVMGLDISDGVFYASGHPGPDQSLPDPLGVLTSTDNGKTWTPEVLTGEVDFHLLKVVGSNLVGVAANYGVVVGSSDGGATWSNLPITNLTSLALNPEGGNEVLLASSGLLKRSNDFGQTFTPAPAPTGIVLVEWTSSGILLSTSSALFKNSGPEGAFVGLQDTFDNIASLATRGDAVIVLDDRGVHISRDGGNSFKLVP